MMKPANPHLQKKFFRTKDRWIELRIPEKKKDGSKIDDDSIHVYLKKKIPKQKIPRSCIEDWDDIKQKYNYNHLYRKRILKIKEENLKECIDDKTKVTTLLETKGEIFSQYANKSKDIAVRGEGVWKRLNGVQIDDLQENAKSQTKSSYGSREHDTDTDIINNIKKCLFETTNKNESDTFENGASEKSLLEKQIQSECNHIVDHEHKKLFIIPECLEEDSLVKESSTERQTEFDLCMKELHDLEKVVDIKDEKGEVTNDIQDPWSKLKECQIDKYGFSDLPFFEEKQNTFEEEEFSEENFYDKIIHSLMKKNVRFRGSKIRVKEIFGEENLDEIKGNLRQADVTVRGADGEYLQGFDLRKAKETEDYEEIVMKQALDTLVGEWTTMGLFLRELAGKTTTVDKQPSSLRKQSLNKQILGPLGKNVREMLSQIVEDDRKREEPRDLSMKIKYEGFQSKCYPRSSFFGKDLQEKIASISYREKTEFKIQKNKKGEHLPSKQTATKNEFNLGTYDVKHYPVSGEKPNAFSTDNFNFMKVEYEGETSESNQTYHRGLVELLSGSKYAGSWNSIGMEGCGIYISPGGTVIEGHMNNGMFHGPATVYLPNGMIITGVFDKGKFHLPKIQFGDGLEYKSKNWEYLNNTRKLKKSEIQLERPILDRDIPSGCYDTGEGFYNPVTKLIYHPISNVPIRSVSEREEKWIVSICRGASPKCVSLNEHLYEAFDITEDKSKKRDIRVKENDTWRDCRSQYYTLLSENDTREQKISTDRFIQIDEKSRPVQELWDNVRFLTGAQKAKIGVPFSYDKSLKFTCFEANKVIKTQNY